MNRADLVATAVEHLLPTPLLLLSGELLAGGTPKRALAAVLSAYRSAELVTDVGRVVTDDTGITGTSRHGDRTSFVSWDTLAGYLPGSLTSARVDDLAAAYRASVSGPDSACEHVATLRSLLAYDVVTTAGLVPPSMLSDTVPDRIVVDGDDAGGFRRQVTLHTIGDTQAACCVNGQVVITMRATPDPHRVAVLFTARGLGEPPPQTETFSGTVRHVPPGDAAGPLPATFAERVGIDVLDENPDGVRWALQVDGFDVAVMEAGNGLRPTVHTAVYDNDPSQPFHRYDGVATVPPLPRGPRSAGAAANRLAAMPHRSTPSPGREP